MKPIGTPFPIRQLPFAVAFAAAAAASVVNPADPQITDFSAVQDFSRVVRVDYTLDEPAYVTVDFLTNGVPVRSEDVSHVTGDVNRLVSAGRHAIAWDARRSWPEQNLVGNVFSVRLTAWAADNPPDVLDIDIVNGTHAYYQSVDALPGGGLTNDIYRTTHLVMKKVYAAGMTFQMGSPTDENYRNINGWAETLHAVALTNDYYLAIYETTRKQFELLGCPDPPFGTANTPNPGDDPDQCPQDRITYNRLRGAAPDIDWPTTGTAVGGYLATIRTATGLALDIPTEAQWEFACRAGTTTQNYSGREYSTQYSSPVGDEIAWYHYNSVHENLGNNQYTWYVHAVGGKPANPWGFYDMYGNVHEWCLDWIGDYDTSVSPAINPEGPAMGTSRCLRGSNYTAMSTHIRSAYRGYGAPQDANNRYGFRLCLPLSQNGTRLSTAAASATVGVSQPFAFVSRDHIAEESPRTPFSTFAPGTLIVFR